MGAGLGTLGAPGRSGVEGGVGSAGGDGTDGGDGRPLGTQTVWSATVVPATLAWTVAHPAAEGGAGTEGGLGTDGTSGGAGSDGAEGVSGSDGVSTADAMTGMPNASAHALTTKRIFLTFPSIPSMPTPARLIGLVTDPFLSPKSPACH